MRITYSSRQSTMNQPGKAANPARGQLNRENGYFFPAYVRSRLRIWSRETGSAIPSRAVSLFILHYIPVLRRFIDCVHIFFKLH